LGEEWEDKNPATILWALNLRRNKKEEGPFQILFQNPQALLTKNRTPPVNNL
jgi:hypothetical protein